ncbi:class III lanthionine synthetase LanKC [Kitasatospora paranensis]|uniref:class III lanthionine synthetase LanKC n=1 Tax=Kitasatospora paranensis TaxID=258053 RepID=UPI0031F1706A
MSGGPRRRAGGPARPVHPERPAVAAGAAVPALRGFTEQFCRSETGELVLALREPSGRLRPDVRRAVFEVPEWAPVPAVLAEALAQAPAATTDAFPFTVERALHFSNGGGIYLARPVGGADGPPVVLKEARPHAGLDQRGDDAVLRLARERDILQRLAGLPQVPAVLGHLTAWEHDFLVQEYVEGEPLNRWFGRHYPLIHPDPDEATAAAYREEALRILDSVAEGLRAIHGRGIVFGDLHPRNLIVRPDGTVAFIDFELASPVDAFVRPALGAAGFAAPPELTGFAVDLHALDALRLWIFLPLLPLTALDPGKAEALTAAAGRRFALPPSALPAAPATGGPAAAAAGQLERLLSGDPADWPQLRDSLAAGIAATATPDRTDRLFPGDPGQFTHDGLGLAYGAAGVLWALQTAGTPVDPEHVRWLLDAVAREPCRPGLYLGSHGVAYALERLGRPGEALNLLDRLLKTDLDGLAPDLAGGLAGVGLTLLHFAHICGDRDLHAAAADVADRLAAGLGPTAGAPAAPGRAGLLHGGSGAALFLLRLYESTADRDLLDLAGRALSDDLARCLVAEDGTLQVDEGTRVLPYLESGSAGIAAVLHEHLRLQPDPAGEVRLEQIRRAAEPEFIVQSGLFNGRAGLIALLHRLQDGTDQHRDVIRRHIRRLAWHLVPYQGHAAFPGEQLLRLSTDLATGSAGVLLGLGAALADTPPLPFWTPGGFAATAPAPGADPGRRLPPPSAPTPATAPAAAHEFR